MKKVYVLTAVVLGIVGLSAFLGTARGQAPAATPPSVQHKVGLIDMAHVFKSYKKFEALREELKAEIEQSDEQAKQMHAQMQSLEAQLKQLAAGSPDAIAKENQLLKLKGEFDAFRQTAQRDFLRKESKIYKTIYLEVADAVQKYAQYYKYTLVMRFDRNSLGDANDPNEVMQRMNRQIVFHRDEDDITPFVLEYLNKRYQTGPAPSPRPPERTTNR